MHSLEADPHEIVSSVLISDYLYGSPIGHPVIACEDLPYLRALESWDNQVWKRLLSEWYIENPSVGSTFGIIYVF
jgi:hypothetical protein